MKKWGVYAVQILLLCFVSWLAWPGLLSSDSQTIFEESKTWSFNSGHPPVMGIVWGVLNLAHESTGLMLCVQLAVFGFGVATLANQMFIKQWHRLLVFAVVMLCPMILSIVGVLWKDIWCTAFIMISAGLMLGQWQGVPRKLPTFLCMLALYIAVLFRPNAVGAVVAILSGLASAWLVLAIRSVYLRRITAIGIAIPLTLLLLYGGTVFDRLFTPGGVPSWSVYTFDIAGVVANSEDPVRTAKQTAEKYPKIFRDPSQFGEMLADSFIPYTAVTLNADWGNDRSPFVLPMDAINTPQYKGARSELIRKNPVAYVRYRTEYLKHLLGFYMTPGAGRNGWVLADLRLAKNFRVASYVGKFESTWLMAPVLWFSACIFVAMSLLVKPSARVSKLLPEGPGWLALSAVGIVGVLFIVGPAPDYRYMFWPTVAGIFLVLWLVFAFFERLLPRTYAMEARSHGG